MMMMDALAKDVCSTQYQLRMVDASYSSSKERVDSCQ